MKRTGTIVQASLVLGIGTLTSLALLWMLGSGHLTAQAQGPDGHSIYYVAPSCAGVPAPCYTRIQAAVDAADDPGDLIKVAAGRYTGVEGRDAPADYGRTGVITQVVYISETLTLRGGYTTTNWITSDPKVNPTILDAEWQGRVIVVAGDISPTLEGLQIVHGSGDRLGGGWPDKNSDAGGGMYVLHATLALSASQIISNVASHGRGGGLYAAHNYGMRLSGNVISDNLGALGGGVYLFTSSGATLEDSTFRANHGGSQGAGLRIRASPDLALVGNVIVDNHSGGDGSQDVGGLDLFGSDYATLTGNVFHSNSTEGHGGGLNVSGCTYTNLSGNVFTGNDGKEGAGVRILHSKHVELAGSVITGNYGRYGAGVYVRSSEHVTLTNNWITDNDNRPEGAGGGVYVDISSLQMLHTTLARNRGGDGSGIYVTNTGSTVALANTILVSHTTGITVAQGSTATLEATLWGTDAWANLEDWGGAGALLTGTINLWGDPAFADPNAGDYHISWNSAAIDEGVDADITIDLDGDLRPSGAGYDMGADEFMHTRSYLPLISCSRE